MTSNVPPPPESQPARRRRFPIFRTIVILAGIFAVLMVIVLAILPSIIAPAVKSTIEEVGSDTLGVPVTIEKVEISYFGAQRMLGLRIGNPEGFGSEPLVAMGSSEINLSLASVAFTGNIDARGAIDGLALRVVQRADGKTNLDVLRERLAPADTPEPREQPQTSPEQGPEQPDDASDDQIRELLEKTRLDFSVRNSSIEIVHLENGELERVDPLEVELTKSFGTTDIELKVHGDVKPLAGQTEPGFFDLRAEYHPIGDAPVIAKISCKGIDLARYHPLTHGFLEPGSITTMQGQVNGSITAEIGLTSGWQAELDGEMIVESPRFAGSLFSGLDVQAPRWVIRPVLAAASSKTAGGLPSLTSNAMHIDLGFLKVDSTTDEAAKSLLPTASLGLKFGVDLAAARTLGIPVPEDLELIDGTYGGTLAIQLPQVLPENTMDWLDLIALDSDVSLGRVAYSGYGIDDLKVDLDVSNGGGFELKTRPGADLFGGALQVNIATALNSDTLPLSVTAKLDGARATGKAAELLQYAVPLLAGAAQAGAGVQVESPLSLDLTLAGPGFQKSGESIVEWLSNWSGTGSFDLGGGRLSPTGTLGQLTRLANGVDPATLVGSLAKQQGGIRGLVPGLTGAAAKAEPPSRAEAPSDGLEFDGIGGSFKIDAGSLISESLAIDCGDRKYPLEGETKFTGDLDWGIDLHDLFKGHKDGERVLKYLGDTPIRAGIGGSLTSPKLEWPDLKELATGALTNLLKDEAGQALQNQLKDALKLPDGDGKALEKNVKKALGGALQGLLGGDKKDKDD